MKHGRLLITIVAFLLFSIRTLAASPVDIFFATISTGSDYTIYFSKSPYGNNLDVSFVDSPSLCDYEICFTDHRTTGSIDVNVRSIGIGCKRVYITTMPTGADKIRICNRPEPGSIKLYVTSRPTQNSIDIYVNGPVRNLEEAVSILYVLGLRNK